MFRNLKHMITGIVAVSSKNKNCWQDSMSDLDSMPDFSKSLIVKQEHE
jgi:hypothetical protein